MFFVQIIRKREREKRCAAANKTKTDDLWLYHGNDCRFVDSKDENEKIRLIYNDDDADNVVAQFTSSIH